MDLFLENIHLSLKGVLIAYILFSLYFWLIKNEGIRAFLDLRLIGINICAALIGATMYTIFA